VADTPPAFLDRGLYLQAPDINQWLLYSGVHNIQGIWLNSEEAGDLRTAVEEETGTGGQEYGSGYGSHA
jgi:hypothetical protein